MERILNWMPEAEMEEAYFLDNLLKEKSDQQVKDFLMIYRARRRDPQITLLTALIGFFGVAGVHRFLLNQIGMGILYLLTAGLCFIGTIVDLVNYRNLTMEYNQKMANNLKSMMH
ncbi:TM2 domain-containing protein [Thermophagus xiamenensis]|jgi:TM2 domain-containing membrane protein YozV|uniref:TM2 domain-containing protein n=1 Tax=Thermophagus xiamenensis TaxID=385682 RepID=A0A1I2AJ39_9BACT|nr:TM2 domain-containing protein [Thermophagus xiamenensis]SFE43558.1 TM2 domain-containing protein [Thermophagus xiamenensis]